MTNWSRICVLCVTNDLHGNSIWKFTAEYTLEKAAIRALNVEYIFHHWASCVSIWLFTQVNTSAPNAANVFKVANIWQYTGDVIQERDRLNVLFVANDSQHQLSLLCTAEFTVAINRTDVAYVTTPLVSLEICKFIWDFTRERNRTSVHCVTNVIVSAAPCSSINVMCTATQLMNWIRMRMFECTVAYVCLPFI